MIGRAAAPFADLLLGGSDPHYRINSFILQFKAPRRHALHLKEEEGENEEEQGNPLGAEPGRKGSWTE